MLSIRTGIGIGVGGTISAIGIFALIISFGLQTVEVNETLGISDSTSFLLNGPAFAEQKLKITGELFDIEIINSVDGELVPFATQKKEFSLTWIHQSDGFSTVDIHNIGQSELQSKPLFK